MIMQKIICFIFLFSLGAMEALALNNVPDDYKLGAGDYVSIKVFEESDLSIEARISSRGSISYPLLGELMVSGLTIKGLESLIRQRLQGPYLVDPKVTASVLEYRQFFVNGEVKSPGGYAYVPGLAVRQAITIAGGFTDRASRNKVFIIRKSDPSAKNNRTNMSESVNPGDTITVDSSFF